MLKRFMSSMICFMILINGNIGVHITAVENNLIRNGSFEEAGVEELLTEGCGIERTTAEKHTGEYAARIYNRTGHISTLRNAVTVQNNKTYVCTVWMKLPAGQAARSFKMLTDPNWIQIEPQTVVTSEWTKLQGAYKCSGPAGGTTTAYLRLTQMDGALVREYYTDDWSVEEQRPTSVKIVGNAGITLPDGQTVTQTYSVSAKDQMDKEMVEAPLVTWSVTDKATRLAPVGIRIDQNGVLNVEQGATTETIVIKAEALSGDAVLSDEKEVSLTYAEQALQKVLDGLTLSTITTEPAHAITKNLTLPESGDYGAIIVWQSSNPTVISNKGILKLSGTEEYDVELTATVTVGGIQGIKVFQLRVPVYRNIITNPGFEDAGVEGIPTEWCSVQRVSEEKRSGNYSAKIYGRTAAAASLRNRAVVKNNIPYICSVWVKLPQGISPQDFILVTDPNWISIGTSTNVSSSGWTQIKGIYICPGAVDGTTEVYLRLTQMSGSAIDFYYTDDWQMEIRAISNAEISGLEELRIPKEGNNEERQYSLKTMDQIGNMLEGGTTIWKVTDSRTGLAPDGITIDQNGMLTLTAGARVSRIKIQTETTLDGARAYGVKEVVVYPYLDEAITVRKDLDELTASVISLEALSAVTQNLTLPKVKVYEDHTANFVWASDVPGAVSDTGEVNRSEIEDIKVTLRVTATVGEHSASKTFEVTVKRLDNFFINGDFETLEPLSWAVTNSENAVFQITEQAKKNGAYGGALTNRKNAEAGICQALSRLKPFRAYWVKGFVKSVGQANGILEIRQNNQTTVVAQKNLSAGAWTELGEVFIHAAEAYAVPQMVITTNDHTSGDLYVDDFIIKDITTELSAATQAVIRAENSRLTTDISKAKVLLEALPDCARKTTLKQRLNQITPQSFNSGSGGNSSGGKSGNKMLLINETIGEDDTEKNSAGFSDIQNHWAKTDILFLIDNDVVNGKTADHFAPEEYVTRAEFAKMVLKARNMESVAYRESFRDVSAESWYAGIVQSVYDAGIMCGYDGYFRPEEYISREEMAAIIVFAYERYSQTELYETEILPFSDRAQISEWAAAAVNKAVNKGYIKGISASEFAPKSFSTRAQSAVIIRRLFDSIR